MNDDDLDRLVAASMFDDTDIHALDLAAGEAELMENIMTITDDPTAQTPPLAPTRRRRTLFAGLAAGGVFLLAGTAYAVLPSLSADRVDVVERANPCGLEAANGQLVATFDDDGQPVEYWTFDDDENHGDWVFTDAGPGGGGGCGPVTRADAHPVSPWAEYLLEVDPATSIFTIYGRAPEGTDEVEITFSVGTVRASVESNGYFVTRQTLPTTPNDTLLRIDALSSGAVIASQPPPFVRS